MKKFLALFMVLLTILSCSATENDVPQPASASDGTLFNGKKVLVAYFSWGGTTRRMAETIENVTKGDIFEIEPVVPYPTSYTPCTEVALEERDSNARPAIKNSVANWEEYDVIFLGGPVWWHTAPMILHTFAESYDFEGKTVVPFCTYASTYRDETLQAIVDMTPEAEHLEGLGTTGSTSGVEAWVNRISAVWEKSHPNNNAGIEDVSVDLNSNDVTIYDLNGRIIKDTTTLKGIFIVKSPAKTYKVVL